MPPMATSSALLVAFIVLKLCHVIDWSWWWVTAPAWIGFVVGFVLVLIADARQRAFRNRAWEIYGRGRRTSR